MTVEELKPKLEASVASLVNFIQTQTAGDAHLSRAFVIALIVAIAEGKIKHLEFRP